MKIKQGIETMTEDYADELFQIIQELHVISDTLKNEGIISDGTFVRLKDITGYFADLHCLVREEMDKNNACKK